MNTHSLRQSARLELDTPRDDMDPSRAELATPVSKIMTSPVRCATAEMNIESLTALLLEQGISAVPVIGADGKPIGIVTKTDLLRRYYEDGEDRQAQQTGSSPEERALDAGFHVTNLGRATVAEVMTPRVYSISMDATVARAAAIMAYEGMHHIVITSHGGMSTGILSSLDVLRWLARRTGYVIPERTQQQPAQWPEAR